MISHIVAMSSNRVIGKDGGIPWSIPEDLNYFKNTTLGHCVIYGKKTFESLPKPLPNRLNVVLSSTLKNTLEETPNVVVFSKISDAIDFCKKQVTRPEEVFVCGGAQVYTDTMHLAKKIYLTFIKKPYEGDRFYPDLGEDFEMMSERQFFNPEEFSFKIYERKYKI